MTEAIIIAVIAAVGSVLGQALIAGSSRKKDAAERARLDERTDQRLLAIEHELTELKAQVREHNGLKQDIAALRADVRNLEKR
jgi:hypothetical protein